MRLVSYQGERGPRAGVLEGGHVRDAGPSVQELDSSPSQTAVPVAEVTLLAPVRPGKIVCVGLNYRDHAEESGLPVPSIPLLFSKFPSSVIGPGDNIVVPQISSEVDYEAELAVVIGRRALRVGVEDALDHVLGYTCLNDVSARDLQLGDGQWIRGKGLDTFCPIGPVIVTTDEIPDPQVLGIRCRVNGDLVQDSSTKEMIFSVAELVSFISQAITLEPGDVIATGTPPGVGFSRTPPIFLRPGDHVEVDIEGIGRLKNGVVGGD